MKAAHPYATPPAPPSPSVDEDGLAAASDAALRDDGRRRGRVPLPTSPALLSVAVLSATVTVSAHGYLKTPRSRNLVAWQDKNWGTFLSGSDDPQPEDCPHCLNRGGTLAQCGVHFGVLNGKAFERNYDRPRNTRGEPLAPNTQGVYAEGSDIDVEVVVTTHHKGHFEFSVCPVEDAVPASVPTAECFARNKLRFISDNLYGAPPDPRYPERAYIAPASVATWTSGAPAEQPLYGASYKMTLRLPPGVAGGVVLLQWYYLTANSCKHEGYAEYPFPTTWGNDVALYPSLPDCQEVPPDGDGVPEQFWNCAEIEILRGSASSTMAGETASGEDAATLAAAASSDDTTPVPHAMHARMPARLPTRDSGSRPVWSQTRHPTQSPTPITLGNTHYVMSFSTPVPTSHSVDTNGLATKTALGIAIFAMLCTSQ